MSEWTKIDGTKIDAHGRERFHDYDREGGVIIMMSGDLEVYGQDGVYTDKRGNPVSDDIAARAGFDVLADKTKRRRAELRAQAKLRVDELMAAEEAKQMADEAAAGPEPKKD